MSNIHKYRHKAIPDDNTAACNDCAEVFCDRGDESEIAIFIQFGKKSFLYVVDTKLQGGRSEVNLERYLGVFFARSLGIQKLNLHINGCGDLEDDIKQILHKDFDFVAVEIVGKILNFRNGFRVTGELLYFCSHFNLQTSSPVWLSLESDKHLEVNEIITAINKQHIQIKAFSYVTDGLHEIARYSDAYFWFQLAFFVRSQDTLSLVLNPVDVVYGVGGTGQALQSNESKTERNHQEYFEVDMTGGLEEVKSIDEKFISEINELLE